MIYVLGYFVISVMVSTMIGKILAWNNGPDYDERRNDEEIEALREMQRKAALKNNVGCK